jgi:4'-phosphopantetheinyl transferase
MEYRHLQTEHLAFRPISFDDLDRVQPMNIGRNEVHVWGGLLDIEASELDKVAGSLSQEEQVRAGRLVSRLHRQRFVAAYAMLRVVLSRYCEQKPQELCIQRTPTGKPFLGGESDIQFNLTHSHGGVLIGIARNRRVGVDLEQLRPEVDVVRLARRFFSKRDQAFIEHAEVNQQQERFLQVWVTKEAVAKATGEGLSFPLDKDQVELSDDGRNGRLAHATTGLIEQDIPVQFLKLDTGWVGAVATDGRDWVVVSCGAAT